MRSGDLRRRITIQRPVITKASGLSSTSWVTHKVVSASIKQMKSYDRANAQASWPGADYTISIRYLPGVTANMRIVDEAGTIYSILGKPDNVDMRYREIRMTCQSGAKAD
jgi:SPP1 family predicted phage head-tail adaptor